MPFPDTATLEPMTSPTPAGNPPPRRGYTGALIFLFAACAVAFLIFGLMEKRKKEELQEVALKNQAAVEKAKDFTQARADYLQALALADEGGKPEALLLLAESLRLQPKGNPAAGLLFSLMTELRTKSSLILRGHTGGIAQVSFSPDGTKILTASEDHTARIWDAHTGRLVLPPLKHEDAILTAVYSSDGTRIATGSEDKTGRVWDAATGQPIGVPIQETDDIRALQFSPDGKRLASGADDSKARIWDAQTGQPITPPIRYHESVFTVAFSPDGSRVVTGTGDGKADILDPATGKPMAETIRHQNNIFTAVFSPDGNRILTGSADRTARIWDAKTGKPLGPVFQHGYWICTAYFNHDATQVVTASWDHTARVWDATTGRAITPPLRHGDAVYSAVFSPDGTLVATASKDHTARVWDAVTGAPLTPPLSAGDEVTGVAFAPDSNSVLAASKDGLVRSYDLPPRTDPPDWMLDLATYAASQIRYDVSRAPELEKIGQLRTRLLASTSRDPWERFGKWYFLESDVRPVSPWGTLSLKDYVEDLITLGDKDSLDYAISLSHDRPAWMVRLVPLRAKLNAAPVAPAKAED